MASTGWPHAIVFDLDGTLVDSAPDIQLAVNAAFARLGVAPWGLDAVKGLIGGGAPAAVARAAAMSGITLSAADEKQTLDRFYAVYSEASAAGRELYPGAHALLDLLAGREIPLGLCTNKAEPIALIALKALRIDRYFGAVVGARDDLPKKPDPAMVLAALGPLGVGPAHALMVGDTKADIGAAKAAGVRSVAISHGYSQVPVHSLGADAVIAALPELPAAIERLGYAKT